MPWARKRGSNHCRATVTLDAATKRPINWKLLHSNHTSDEFDKIARNKRKVYLHEMIDTLVAEDCITFQQLEERIAIIEQREKITIIENNEDRKILKRLSDQYCSQIRGSLVSSRISNTLSTIDGTTFLIWESTKPAALLFALPRDIRQLNVNTTLMILAVRENDILPDGFRFMYIGFTVDKIITPRFWLLSRASDKGLWKMPVTNLETNGFISSRITTLIIGMSQSYASISSNFTNKNLCVRVAKDLYIQNTKKLMDEFDLCSDISALELLTMCDKPYTEIKKIKNIITRKKGAHAKLIAKWDAMTFNRYSQFCDGSCASSDGITEVVSWINHIDIPGNMDDLIMFIIESHKTLEFDNTTSNVTSQPIDSGTVAIDNDRATEADAERQTTKSRRSKSDKQMMAPPRSAYPGVYQCQPNTMIPQIHINLGQYPWQPNTIPPPIYTHCGSYQWQPNIT